MAKPKRVGRKALFTSKQLGVGLLIALLLMYLPLNLGVLNSVGLVIVLVTAILLLFK